MRTSARAQSATSLPAAPRDDASQRMRSYLLTMGIRIACLILMVTVVPYGWYTFVFAAGAVVLPYVAVVIANAGQSSKVASAQNPGRSLPSTPSKSEPEGVPLGVIRLDEKRPDPP